MCSHYYGTFNVKQDSTNEFIMRLISMEIIKTKKLELLQNENRELREKMAKKVVDKKIMEFKYQKIQKTEEDKLL